MQFGYILDLTVVIEMSQNNGLLMIIVSHETIRSWEIKFGELFKNIIRKRSISHSYK